MEKGLATHSSVRISEPINIFFFFAMLHGLWDPNSWTKDRTYDLGSKSSVLTTELPGNLLFLFLMLIVKLSKVLLIGAQLVHVCNNIDGN